VEVFVRLVGVTVGVLVVAGLVVYAVFGADVVRWGCPSQEELQRPRSLDEVVDAYGDRGLPLRRTAWPPELRHARAYEGAVVLRHDAPGATLTLVVCKAHCELPQSQLRPGRERRRFRFGFSTVNFTGWIAGENRRAAARLRKDMPGNVGPTVDPGSRCYIG
jgi:hypothetical protein